MTAQERRMENAGIMKAMSAVVHDGRKASKAKASALVERAIRKFPMSRFPQRKERVERMIEWIFERTTKRTA